MIMNLSAIDDIPEVVDEPVEVEAVEVEVAEEEGIVPAVAAPVAKKAIGIKEVPPFKWKLVGSSGDLRVTLFKNAEREEVEAQFDRLTKEGYYRNLEILDIDAKVEQPKPLIPPKSKGAAKKVLTPEPAKSKPAAKVSEPDRGKAAEKSSKKKPEPPKPAKKPAAKAEKDDKSSKAKSKAKPPAKKAARK